MKMRYTYNDVRAEFTPRCPTRRKVMHNTYLLRERDMPLNPPPIRLLYHATEIIKWMPNGDVLIDTDGWHTSTTKLRLNNYLSPLRIYQDRGQWFWHLPDSDWKNRVPFTDGDMVKPNGEGCELVTKVPIAEALQAQKSRRKEQARVLKYAKLYKDKLPFDGKANKGDCWFCLSETDKGAGECGGDHIQSHIDEGYVMSSLCYNALNHPDIPTAPVMWWAAFKGPEGQTFPDKDGWIKDRIVKAIAKYCRIRLGLVR